jgi:hypothetical protein
VISTPDPLWVVPLLHPAAVIRGRWADEPDQIRYLRRALSIAAGEAEPPSIDALLEGALLDPTVAQINEWADDLLDMPDPSIAVDIECAGPHLVCVGMCPLDRNYASIVVPFRRTGGEPAWPDLATTESVVRIVNRVLMDPGIPLWFHNGQAFDVPYLERVGFEINGYAGDTLLLARYLEPEATANLQSLAIRWLGFPAWKHMKNEEQPDDK